MSEREIIEKIEALLAPKGERYSRAYRAFEGGVRVISKDERGIEHRYAFGLSQNNEVTLTAM